MLRPTAGLRTRHRPVRRDRSSEVSVVRLRDAGAGTTIAGVQNHIDFGDRQHRSVLGTAARRNRGIVPELSIAAQVNTSSRLPVPWDRLERPEAVA